MVLKGKIVKGLGKAKKFVSMMSENFFIKTNIELYPGTLNIKLDKPYNLNIDYTIKAEEYGGSFDVQIQKCKLFGNASYIVRSEKNTANNGDYGQDIIEIVSDINFREKYNLKDGDKIEIQI